MELRCLCTEGSTFIITMSRHPTTRHGIGSRADTLSGGVLQNSSGMEGGFGAPAAACAVPSAEGDDAPKTGLEHTVEPSEVQIQNFLPIGYL